MVEDILAAERQYLSRNLEAIHLRNFFAQQASIELALLIGSRAVGRAREDSDWDFAVQWRRDIPWGECAGIYGNLARRSCQALAGNAG